MSNVAAKIATHRLEADYGKFILEPLERGFGQTIGNALRRVLLSSISGASIAAIRIDKIFHEFGPIPGVKEDATQLILNLKDLAVRYTGTEGFEEATLTIDVKGKGIVTGSDVTCPEQFRVVNPECYLATISEAKASLSIELYVGWGAGYVLPINQEKYRGIIGVIPTGSQYTPVRKVNYTVEQTRVGMRTDFERLVLDIWTNGSVSPNDALSQSAHILEKYFRMFFEVGNMGLISALDDEPLDADELLRNVPETRIEELDFSQRTFNCLRRANIMNLRQMASTSESDLSSIRGFGKKSLNEVKEKMKEMGFELRPSKAGFRGAEAFEEELEEDDDF